MADDFVIAPLLDLSATVLGELHEPRAGDRDDKFTRTYQRAFLVQTADRHSASRVASLAATLPAIRDAYSVAFAADEADPGAFVEKISAKCHNGHPRLWETTVNYTSLPAHPDYQHDDPLAIKARVKVSFERQDEFIITDLDGVEIANSAGEAFDPVKVDGYYMVIEIKKNLPASIPDTILAYLGATNTGAAFGRAAFTLKVNQISQDDEEFRGTAGGGVRFWPSTLVMHCKAPAGADFPKPWQLDLIDRGTRTRSLTGLTQRVRDRAGRVLGQALLDLTGQQLAFGSDPLYLPTFKVCPELSFATLVTLFQP